MHQDAVEKLDLLRGLPTLTCQESRGWCRDRRNQGEYRDVVLLRPEYDHAVEPAVPLPVCFSYSAIHAIQGETEGVA